MKIRFVIICLSCLLALAARPAAATSLAFKVTVDTAPLVGNPAGPYSLDFQLNGLGPNANTATISGFDFGTGSAVGPAVPFGGASGDLTSGVMLSDASNPFNELYEQFTPGNSLSFFVTLTENVNTPTPDAFAFAILDGNLFNIPTTGLGDSLALVNITSSMLTLNDVQTFSGVNVPGGPNYSGVTAQASPVPEPVSLLLLGTGLAATAAGRRRRQRTAPR